MKIVFVQGVYEHKDGNMSIWSSPNDCYVKGYFEVTRVYDTEPIRRLSKIKTKILIVKQKNWWKMFRTLCHESAHWFVFTFITKEKVNKYDKWIDR